MSERKRMGLDELRETPEFQILTQKQQLFVATYCDFGLTSGTYDAVEAARIAYTCKSKEVARVMSYSLMQNIRIVSALNRHFGTEPIEIFLKQLDRAINNKRITPSMVQALRLKCDVLGLGSRIPYENHSVLATQQAIKESEKKARKAKAKATPPLSTQPEAPTKYSF